MAFEQAPRYVWAKTLAAGKNQRRFKVPIWYACATDVGTYTFTKSPESSRPARRRVTKSEIYDGSTAVPRRFAQARKQKKDGACAKSLVCVSVRLSACHISAVLGRMLKHRPSYREATREARNTPLGSCRTSKDPYESLALHCHTTQMLIPP